eukprot:TRINITY_DN10592_c0_g1_i1.p1 TRINITY_DN10592_c0_g1~~TRINITY_DN10592_c0_g1_i1.p1  ORF type:complete len:285 (-),score=45.51 TRINITY_DN10592_c0_g1_i1:41-895(-)
MSRVNLYHFCKVLNLCCFVHLHSWELFSISPFQRFIRAMSSFQAQGSEYKVRISYLIDKMRSAAMLEVMMEQIGIEDDLIACDHDTSKDVILSFRSKEAAMLCVNHFDRRTWSDDSAPTLAVLEAAKESCAPALVPPPGLVAPPRALSSFIREDTKPLSGGVAYSRPYSQKKLQPRSKLSTSAKPFVSMSERKLNPSARVFVPTTLNAEQTSTSALTSGLPFSAPPSFELKTPAFAKNGRDACDSSSQKDGGSSSSESTPTFDRYAPSYAPSSLSRDGESSDSS